VGVIQTTITDHYSTILSIPLIKHFNFKSQYNLESINFDKIVNNLKTELWINLYNSKNVNKCCDIFYNILNNAISSATEVKNISAKHKRIKQWMTAGLLCSARNKQKIAMKVKKHPNNTNLLKYYINYKNKFTNILRLTKINFFKTKFKNVASSPKLTWKLIKEITNTEVNSSNEIKSILIDNKVINALDEPHAISNFFNSFFY